MSNYNAYVSGIREKYLILEVESLALETMATFKISDSFDSFNSAVVFAPLPKFLQSY